MSQCSALWIAKKLLLASWGLKLECSQSMSSIAAKISLSLSLSVCRSFRRSRRLYVMTLMSPMPPLSQQRRMSRCTSRNSLICRYSLAKEDYV